MAIVKRFRQLLNKSSKVKQMLINISYILLVLSHKIYNIFNVLKIEILQSLNIVKEKIVINVAENSKLVFI